ncbi:hypothetical protein [Nibrella viscosa]|uniref:hypothetical protein n=1 Tax=Nibrella viscosa TaxID=1084524 RepID=UPI0031E8DCCD
MEDKPDHLEFDYWGDPTSLSFKGRLVGEVEAYNPELNFSFIENEEASQTGKEVDWTEVVRDLLPIEINRFAAYNGGIELVNLFRATNTGLTLKNMNLLKQMPDFNYDLKLDDLQLVKLNKILRSYADLDFEAGTVSVVSEMAMYDGKLQGYFKPLTKHKTVR